MEDVALMYKPNVANDGEGVLGLVKGIYLLNIWKKYPLFWYFRISWCCVLCALYLNDSLLPKCLNIDRIPN